MDERREACREEGTQGFMKVRIREKMNKGYSNPSITVSFIAFLLLANSERLIKMLCA